MVEVAQALQQLGLKTCPVCDLEDSLSLSHLPALLVDGGFPPCINDDSLAEERDGDLIFALRIECTACGYLMLFNAERFRTADDKIIVLEGVEDDGQFRE
jgi:Zn ribbon nucleic-acid-binding protein